MDIFFFQMKPNDVIFTVVCSLFFCIFLSVDRYLSVFFYNYGHSALDIGILLAIKNCFTFTFSFCLSHISVYYDIKLPIILLALIYDASLIQLFNVDWIITNYTNTLIVFTLFSILYRSYIPLVNVYTIQVCLDNDSSKYGNLRIYGAIGSGLGTIIYGVFIYIYDFYNILPIVFGISNILSFLLTIFLYYYTKPMRMAMSEITLAKDAVDEIEPTSDEVVPLVGHGITSDDNSDISDKDNTIAKSDSNININTSGGINSDNATAVASIARAGARARDDDQDQDEKLSIIDYLHGLNWFEFGKFTIMSLNVLIYGILMSIIDSYLYIYFIQEYDANYLFISIAIIAMIIGELPIFQFSKNIIQFFGNNVLLLTAQITYIFRMICYTEIIPHESKYVWYILIIQPLHGLCYATMWIATVDMAHKTAKNKHLQVTIQAFMDGMLSGICNVFGTLIGGLIYQYCGATELLRICALAMFAWMVIFVILLVVLHKCNVKLMFSH